MKIRFPNPRVLVVLLLFAGVGSYFVFTSQAYNNDDFELYFADPENTEKHPAGEIFDKKLYVNKVPIPSASQNPSGKLHVDLKVDSSRSRVEYLAPFTCAPYQMCTPGEGYVAGTGVDGLRQDFHTCIDIAQGSIGKQFVPLLTIRYKSLQSVDYQMRVAAEWASGSCSNPSGSYTLSHLEGWLFGRCGSNGSDHDCFAGHSTADTSDYGSGTSTEGANSTGGGTVGNGTGFGPGDSPSPDPGSGSGGGGSSAAQKQSNTPNPLPTTSPQGDTTEQPDIEPSPFFDGKDYDKGSDPDNALFGSSTVAGRKIPKLVLYTTSLMLLASAAGALWWRKFRGRR